MLIALKEKKDEANEYWGSFANYFEIKNGNQVLNFEEK